MITGLEDIDVKALDDRVAVAGQIRADHVPAIAAAGFACVMMNRPAQEEYGQPDWGEIVAACEAAGIEARYVPMSDRASAMQALEGFRAALAEVDGPIFAFCRSGARCEILYRAALG
ncbi:TIGR01244 family sulfur transferase [Aliiroseovarius sp.]|uniref:TIGR01244 family sulfur transferase n=1 Tax=Aliiroseovarius sp. TaxID=1872442 RepID=UPI00261414D1|nr:TIGR01244 family sulfur transferase [Aliiroseovarius sp.]